MKLLIDAGNTRIKWVLQHTQAPASGFAAGGDVLHSDDSAAAVNDLVVELVRCQKDMAVSGFSQIVVVNVGGEALQVLMHDALSGAFGLEPVFLSSEAGALGVVNGYADPGQLGVDRWVAMLAAAGLSSGAVCIVDAGTAITIDYLDAQHLHHGGVIVPGVQLMQQSLFARTGDIEHFAQLGGSDDADGDLGRGTFAAVQLGAMHAAAGAVHSLLSGRGECHLIVTGGDAPMLLPWLQEYGPEYRPQLVLEGIARRAELL